MSTHQGRQALVDLRRLLSPCGRLIVNMSACFRLAPPAPAAASLPVQFQTTPFTKAPGSRILTARRAAAPVQVPSGGAPLARKDITLTLKVAPDQFWVTAATQATAIAQDAGFVVNRVYNIGKGDSFGLANGPQSPPQIALNNMSFAQSQHLAQTPPPPGANSYIGRLMHTVLGWTTQGWNQMTPNARDTALTLALQYFVAQDRDRVEANNRFLPANGITVESLQWPQVGVMLVLVPM
ncbi:hypothetical protein HBH98_243920 [Parastagonospora nodorum]|nr:hypothetical protein HBH53_230630 [Parastagonospora nodorum]KAH3956356.1 hypothetical protein HBH51_243980 [Parastagonospora nodorum]KAH4215523.1 hypothetical protein HBI06_248030 [Parastagonospora nodorum]KAH4224222.1 hypothetical protein HBI05_242170 [Parastagonospora nodorum]KAH4334257.1 hypothetical protein HBH98_243920 [Parastagonospora nodorum]